MEIKLAKRLVGTGEYYFSKKLKEIAALQKAGADVINLGIGSPDLPPHNDVIHALHEAASQPGMHTYQGYRGADIFRQGIASWYQRNYNVDLDPVTEILPLMGSKEGIMHICMTYLSEGDEVLIPNPGYPTYRSAAQLAGGICREYLMDEKTGHPDLLKLAGEDLSKVKMMFLNYPHMPTGKEMQRAGFEKLVHFAKDHQILLIHDNAYSFILTKEPLSILSIDGAMDTALELNSLSKSHNMAGWRVGMVCGNAERINEILRFKSNMDSGMFLPVQMAAVKALSLGKEWHDHINSVYKKRKQKVHELIKDTIGCTYDEQQAGLFVWARVPKDYESGYALSDELLDNHNIFITPGGIFGSAGNLFVRISLCSTDQLFDKAINRIKNKGK